MPVGTNIRERKEKNGEQKSARKEVEESEEPDTLPPRTLNH